MFSYLSSLLSEFHSKPILFLLIAAFVLLTAAVFLWSFARWLRQRKQDRPETWAGLVTGSMGAMLKVLVGIAVLAALAMHLRYSSGEFVRKHGGVSEKNYQAVESIWGRPHVQNELTVREVTYTTHYQDKDGLEFDIDKIKATTQPIAFRKVEQEEPIDGNPIVDAQHEIKLAANYRTKGGASYPGFEADCRFQYKIVNLAGRDVTAHFAFPMPSRQGLIDHLNVTVDGQPIDGILVTTGEAVKWKMPLKPGQNLQLAVSYHTRGLDHLRFEPGAGRAMQKYRIALLCQGIKKADINYPLGCMTPTTITEEGGNTALEWKLDKAVTRLAMGVIIPKLKQEGYYVGRILTAAPWGLVLLLTMVLVTYVATGRSFHWVPLLLLAMGYHLYYLLMANIGDYWPGLVGGMLISGAVLLGLMALLHLKTVERFPAVATLAFFALFCFAYPFIRISDDESLLLTIVYVALLAYVIVLVVRRRKLQA